ncbi:hypothetical protein [Rhodococcus sp. NPDC047139]
MSPDSFTPFHVKERQRRHNMLLGSLGLTLVGLLAGLGIIL